MPAIPLPRGLELRGPVRGAHAQILTAEALEFYADLHRHFNARRLELLEQRRWRQGELDRGRLPEFSAETRSVREGRWQVLPVPEDLHNRRVEITGPVDRKMVINALNCGANCFMADFEDAHSPTWTGTLDGQLNVRDAVRGSIEFTSAEGKNYRLNRKVATLLVRPRGWHLSENHLWVDGEPASASLFDFALYFFHNARFRVLHDSGVYLYLPKLEHYLEARLWDDVFVRAQEKLHIPQGTIKATVLIEHILAAFQMEEILYELRHHSAGLNCGRWDYIFSYIKKFARHPDRIVPDRSQVTMATPFMRAYSLNCIKTCHRRGTFAMGGMSACIPIKCDPEANLLALLKVREDKHREAQDGHDGTWVAHPGLVGIAREEFDRVLGTRSNQIDRRRDDVQVSAAQLLEPPRGTITEAGLRLNVRVCLQYLEAWLSGQGCVPLYNLMEDAATAEISRAQVWQWVHNSGARLENGRRITLSWVRELIQEELERIFRQCGAKRYGEGYFGLAARLFDELLAEDDLAEFLTLRAYEALNEIHDGGSKSLPAKPSEQIVRPALPAPILTAA